MTNQTEENEIDLDKYLRENRPRFKTIISKHKNILPSKLDKIKENDEENYFSNVNEEDKLEENIDQKELISKLREKISELEEKILELKSKNEELKKDNIQTDSKLKRMSFIGVRKKFSMVGDTSQDSVKIANLIKEKNDLQEINEKMLNMLTEKELQNEELQEDFEAYKTELKTEIKKYLETIDELEQKNEILEENAKNQENMDDRLDDVLNQYNSYKKRMEESMMEYIKNEEDMKKQIDEKENIILKMKNNIQSLELENMQLQNQSKRDEKIRNEEYNNYEQLLFENNTLRDDNNNLVEKMKEKDKKIQNFMKEKEDEINKLSQDIEDSKNSFEKMKNDKNNEINSLKKEILNYNRDLNSLIKKNDSLQKGDQETKKNLYQMQNKLEKKTKELQELTESTKKLIENKNYLLQQYEDKIDEINQEKNLLIQQNHELLDKVKSANIKSSSKNLEDLLNEEEENENQDENSGNKNNKEEDNFENVLLKQEIKSLKEQLANQANDLVNLNAMEKEVTRLKSENEKLIEDFKLLKEKMKKQKYEEGADELMNLIKNSHRNTRKSLKLPKLNTFGMKDIPIENKKQMEKQIDAINQIKGDEKQNLLDEIDKLKGDIAVWKVKFLNQELENETMIVKYKNIIKTINNQCIQRGIKLNFSI